MPNTPRSFLEHLGMRFPSAPAPLTPEENAKIATQQTPTQQNIGKFLDFLTGVLGLSAEEEPVLGPVKGTKPNFPARLGEFVGVAVPEIGKVAPLLGVLPFRSFAPELRSVAGKPTVFHGTKGQWERIDPTKHNVRDTLGWMFHAAEDPSYAETYAYGPGRHIKPVTSSAQRILDLTQPLSPDDAELVAEAARIAGRKYNFPRNFNSPSGLNPGFTDPALTNSQDILDFQQYLEHFRDMASAQRKLGKMLYMDIRDPRLLQQKRIVSELESKVNALSKKPQLQSFQGINNRHIFEHKLRAPFNDPTITKQLGVQGIRYTDVNKPVFAFSDMSTLSSPFGPSIAPDIPNKKFARWLATMRHLGEN